MCERPKDTTRGSASAPLAACAAVVAGVLTGRTEREVLVHLRGGDVTVGWAGDGPVRLRGGAVEVFEGTVDV